MAKIRRLEYLVLSSNFPSESQFQWCLSLSLFHRRLDHRSSGNEWPCNCPFSISACHTIFCHSCVLSSSLVWRSSTLQNLIFVDDLNSISWGDKSAGLQAKSQQGPWSRWPHFRILQSCLGGGWKWVCWCSPSLLPLWIPAFLCKHNNLNFNS